MNNHRIGAFAVLATFAFVSKGAYAYSYDTCNGTPVVLNGSPWNFNLDGTCSMPAGSAQANAAIHGLDEWGYYALINEFTHNGNSPPGCHWQSGDGVSEVATVSPSTIGGLNGETFTVTDDSCFWWNSTEHITEADILVANTLDFGWPDECWVGSNFSCQTSPLNQQNGTCDIGLGNFTFLHEPGHALGLNHSPGQVVMHNGPPVPYGGGGGGGGGVQDAAALFPDDIAGARFLYSGAVRQFHNVMAADTHEPSAGADALTVNNDASVEPAGWGAVFYGCPGNQMPLWNTAVNNGTYTETFNQNIYANTCPSCISGGSWIGGWTNTWMPAATLISSYYTWSVPGGSIPRNQSLWVFLDVDSGGTVPIGGVGERFWDNFTHYPFVLYVNSVGTCGS